VSASQADRSPADLPGLAGARILVVEDHDDSRDALRLLLEGVGAAVVVAESGARALALLDEMAVFDLVLADIRMPGMSGLQLARRVRQDPRWAGIPLVAITAGTTMDDLLATLEAGFQAHLSKPVEPDVLEFTLRRSLAGRQPPTAMDMLVRCSRCQQGIETLRGYVRDGGAPYHPRCFPERIA
jgi:CheY-like chemotaxis protein